MHPLRSGPFFACAALLAAGISAAAAAPAGEKYLPQFSPQFTAGQVFSYSANATYESLMSVDQASRQVQQSGPDLRKDDVEDSHDDFIVRLTADTALAREVFKNGSLREAEFLVTRCELVDSNGRPDELVPANSIIGARKQADGQIAFAINGEAPSPQLAARLSVLINMGDEHNTSSDLLGPPGPVAAGDEWPVNESAMLNSDLASLFPGVRSVAGGVSFLKVLPDSSGTPRGIVSSEYALGDVKPPFPPDIHPRPSLVHFKVLATAPLLPGPGQYDLKLGVEVNHQGQTGNVLTGMTETDVIFGIQVDQSIHYSIATNPGDAASALVNAPAEPDAPPLPPGLSAAPIYRPHLAHAQKVTEQTDNSAPAPATASTAASTITPTAPMPAPETPLPPLTNPDFKSLSPFSGAQPLPPLPAPQHNSN
jgi:hypothetical protein